MNINDVIMVDIDGNAVACTILEVHTTPTDPACEPFLHLLDTASGRVFNRTIESLMASRRFDGQIVTYTSYADWLLANRPDCEVRFLSPSGKTLKESATPRPRKPTTPTPPTLTASEQAALLRKILAGDI